MPLNYSTLGRDAPGSAAPVTQYGYDAIGNLTSVTDPRANATTTEYDALNRKIRTTEPSPDSQSGNPISTYGYDLNGNLLTFKDALLHTTTSSYDVLNRKLTTSQPDPNSGGTLVTHYAYDASGNLTGVTDPLGHLTTTVYDALNQKIQVIEPVTVDGGSVLPTTLYGYDAAGNLLSVRDPSLNVTTYVYDALNRQTSATNQLSQSRSTVYDAAGNIISSTDRDGRTIQYVYDNLNRQTTENWLDGSGAVVYAISSVFDVASRLTQQSDPDSSYRFGYDHLSRVTSIDNIGTPAAVHVLLNLQYDANGNRTSMATQVGGTWNFSNVYAYDALNRLSTVTQSVAGGIVDKQVQFTYDL